MAFLASILNRIARPSFNGLNSSLTATSLQLRGYAARKGTREKALKKKRAFKMKRAAQLAQEAKRVKIRTASTSIKMTVPDAALPPICDDIDVFFASSYQPKQYSIIEAVINHKQCLDPSVMNIGKAKIQILMELDMTAEKKTKVMNPWQKIVLYPNIFEIGHRKKIMVLCQQEFVQKALNAGADLAGGISLIKDIKKGDVDLSAYDRVIGQLDFHPEISAIRSKLKLHMPKIQNGTLTADFLNAIPLFKYGLEYKANLSESENAFGWIDTIIGLSNMEPELLEENFMTLLRDVNLKKPKREGSFITYAYCSAPPSKEKFLIDLASYLSRLDEENKSEAKNVVDEKSITNAKVAEQ